MSLDSRGVRRGRCLACTCDGYDGGTEKKKCTKCAHPPGKHENTEAAPRSAPATNFPHSAQHSYSSAANAHSHATSSYVTGQYYPAHSTPAATHQHYATGSSSGYHSESASHHYQWQSHLPMCLADGCTNPVWYEPGLPESLRGSFAYCSPGCRDRHLLPIRRQQLSTELEELKQELQRAAASDSSTKTVKQQPLYSEQPSQVSHSGSSFSPSPTPAKTDKKKTKQKSSDVIMKKLEQNSSGLILQKKPLLSDEGVVIGFLIVGVVRDSKVYTLFQDDKLRLLDTITSVDGRMCSDMFLPGKDPQDCFEYAVNHRQVVNLNIDRSLSLPPASKSLSIAKGGLPFTHVSVVRYSPQHTDDNMFGLTLGQHDLIVKGVIKDSPADLSRIKFDDEICAYAIASEDEVKDTKLVNEKSWTTVGTDFLVARIRKRNIILFVKRFEPKSTPV